MARQSANVAKVKTVALSTAPYPAPDDFTEAQAKVWNDLIARLGNVWFPFEVHGLLAAYCRHIVSGNALSGMIDTIEGTTDFDITDPGFFKTYKQLLEKREGEYRAASSLATRLRFTTQATVKETTAKKPGGDSKPWGVNHGG